MEAFQSGIGAAQAQQKQTSDQMGTIAQVMATAMQISAQHELQKMKNLSDLQVTVQQGINSANVATIGEEGLLARTKVTTEGTMAVNKLTQEYETARANAAAIEKRAIEEFQARSKYNETMDSQKLKNEGALDVEKHRAYSAAQQHLLTEQGLQQRYEQTGGRHIAEARLAALYSTSNSPEALKALSRFGVAPVEMRARNKEQMDIQSHKAGLLKTQAEIQRYDVQNQVDIHKSQLDDQQMIINMDTLNISHGVLGNHYGKAAADLFTTAINNNAGMTPEQKLREGQILTRLEQLTSDPNPENAVENSAEAYKLLNSGQSQLSQGMWDEILKTRALASYHNSMGMAASGHAILRMPLPAQQAAFEAVPAEAQSVIRKIAAWVPFGNTVMKAGDYVSQLTGNAGVPTGGDDFRNAFIDGYRRVNGGRDPDRKTMDAFTMMPQTEQAATLRKNFAGVSAEAADVLRRYNDNGHTLDGLVITAGLDAGGALIGGAVAKGVGRYLMSTSWGRKLAVKAAQKVGARPASAATVAAEKEASLVGRGTPGPNGLLPGGYLPSSPTATPSPLLPPYESSKGLTELLMRAEMHARRLNGATVGSDGMYILGPRFGATTPIPGYPPPPSGFPGGLPRGPSVAPGAPTLGPIPGAGLPAPPSFPVTPSPLAPLAPSVPAPYLPLPDYGAGPWTTGAGASIGTYGSHRLNPGGY